jgi:PAS domain S-box-containing protein
MFIQSVQYKEIWVETIVDKPGMKKKQSTPLPDPKVMSVIFDSVADGVFTINQDWKITSFNSAAEGITGVPRAETIGRPCWEVFRASICEGECVLRHSIETGKPVINREIYIIRADGERIPISISTAVLRDEEGNVIGGVETFRDLSIVNELRKELSGKFSFADIISKNHNMHSLFNILPDLATSDSTILITGESGTGKELFAKAIHNLSSRKEKPLITVNCGALPDTLLESELFGAKAGAFTDAKKDRKGRFETADGGTIFLDEIGDISPALQVKLLRVLQEKKFEPLGSDKTVQVDVRIITATNQDLETLIAEGGKFREDLYYRINVVKLDIPPLRNRKEDIPLLVDHFIQRFNRLRGKDIAGISTDALSALMNHDFPGNIRELENAIEHAFAVCRENRIEQRHLPEKFRASLETHQFGKEKITLHELEAQFITDVLKRNNWNRQAAAADLGIHKTTLWRKMRKLEIHPPENHDNSE